ncbi:hypothetical protein CDD83_10502 [Cordyceps sp. RAO-2017]|nr:hypothetical protein CDD83_10502 [Cordyceps sp. RAO-2017]
MLQLSPPRLAIPASSPSPSGASTPTGRPSMWTASAQRKMARLYVYTTLPLEVIVKLVHYRFPHSAPGLDSANKKLSSLLDKEPRWLHPRNESDMGRRLTQLSNSQPRLASAEEIASCSPLAAADDGISLSPPGPFCVKSETPTSPMARGVSPSDSVPSLLGSPLPFSTSPLSSTENLPSLFSGAASHDERPEDAGAFSSFLRRTTCLSASTEGTTESFRQILRGYSDPYVRTVKRLVKRFTAPMTARSSPSPLLEGSVSRLPSSSPGDQDGPSTFGDEPRLLPGDFLSLDLLVGGGVCCALPEAHRRRRCICFDQFDDDSSPWINTGGLTSAGQRLMAMRPTRADFDEVDSFGNTVLHFLAARGLMELLPQVLQAGFCDAILNDRNTAGQTFLHVAKRSEVRDVNRFHNLLYLAFCRGFDVGAVDVYGRSISHVLRVAGVSSEAILRICPHVQARRFNSRDAFGAKPVQEHVALEHRPESMDVDPSPDPLRPATTCTSRSIDGTITREARLLEVVRLAREDPLLEDEDGRNGLHCLASATLSADSVADKYGLDPGPADEAAGGRRKAERQLDSGSAALKFRLSLATGLVEAGVEANHYDGRGETPLMAFAAELPEEGDHRTGPEILALLIRHGADVRARNRSGETALHVAVRRGRKLAMRTLVEHGASVHARDADGRSVLDVADAQMLAGDPRQYARYEACRAWLSSSRGLAVQRPTAFDEWRR